MQAGGRLALLACLAGAALAPTPGRAGCAAPSLDGMPHDRRAGQLILVAGEGWTQGCDDNGGSCGGCGSCEEDPGAPAQEITISLERRGDAVAELGIIEPDAGASFAEELRLPEDLEPGRYRLVARGTPGGYHQWSPIRVTR